MNTNKKLDMNKHSIIGLSSINRVAILALVLLIASVVPVIGQQADTVSVSKAIGSEKVLTLTEAIHVAMANNSQVKRSLLSLENADEQVRLAWILSNIDTADCDRDDLSTTGFDC